MPDPKKLAQSAAKIARDEGFEILKTAGEQLKGGPDAPEPTASQEEQESQEKEKVKQSDLRRIEALETEMKQIREQRQREYQQRAAEQFPEQQGAEPPPMEEPSTKPKRGLFKGPKARAEKAKRATELVKMPSG